MGGREAAPSDVKRGRGDFDFLSLFFGIGQPVSYPRGHSQGRYEDNHITHQVAEIHPQPVLSAARVTALGTPIDSQRAHHGNPSPAASRADLDVVIPGAAMASDFLAIRKIRNWYQSCFRVWALMYAD